MKPEELEYVHNVIENEGFGYTFMGYTSFEEIKDPEFHKLRLAFIAAGKALKLYIHSDE